MSFKLDLERFASKTGAKVDTVLKKIVTDLGTSLVLKSPVGDGKYWKSPPPEGYVGGRFRANWQLSLDGIDSSTSEKIDKTGEVTIASIVGNLPAEAKGRVFYITNSLPYALRLEQGWSHRQAPRGMVAITVLEFQQTVDEAARALQ